MNLFLKYLIRKLYTLDGRRESATKLIELHCWIASDSYMKEKKLKEIPKKVV